MTSLQIGSYTLTHFPASATTLPWEIAMGSTVLAHRQTKRSAVRLARSLVADQQLLDGVLSADAPPPERTAMNDLAATPTSTPQNNKLQVSVQTLSAEQLLRMVSSAIARGTFTAEQLRELNHDTIAQIRILSQLDSQSKFLELHIGQRVQLAQIIRPQYLRGATAMIIARQDDRFVIDLDFRRGKYHRGVTIEANLLEPLG